MREWHWWAILVVPRVWVSLRELQALEGTYARCAFTPRLGRDPSRACLMIPFVLDAGGAFAHYVKAGNSQHQEVDTR
jgi:hypothetical protein